MGIIFAMFIQGVISFFSPCILSLIPIYMGYLTSDAKSFDDEGKVVYQKKKVLLTTFFFVLGISSVFFLTGLSVSVLRRWIYDYQIIFTILGGMTLIFMGLFHIGIISVPWLQRERRVQVKPLGTISFVKAFLLGFLFSFAWTPCIGPLLSSALILSASAESSLVGNSYILAYTLGFISSFMVLGFFTEEILNMFKKNQKVITTIVKIGGVIVLVMGSWMLGTSFQEILLLQRTQGTVEVHDIETCDDPTHNHQVGTNVEKRDLQTDNFSLEDQNGQLHTLSDYSGEPLIVTFFATWCPYCKEQMDVLKLIQEEQAANILIIVNPNYNNEGSKEDILKYIEDNQLENLTILFDDTSVLRMYDQRYGVSGYPTSFIYRTDGDLLGRAPGAVAQEAFLEIIEQAK